MTNLARSEPGKRHLSDNAPEAITSHVAVPGQTMGRNVKVCMCKHCGKDVYLSAEVIFAASGKLGRKLRKTDGGPQKVLKRCRHCRQLCSAKFIRLHEPRCAKKPKGPGRRPVIDSPKIRAAYLELATREPHFEVVDGKVRPRSGKLIPPPI